MLKRKSTNQIVWSVALFVCAMPAAVGQPTVTRNAVSARQVADAMAVAGIDVNASQIELLPGPSTEANASLRVVSVNDRATGAMKVKLRCLNNRECLPFYVLVHGGNGMKLRDARERESAAAAASPVQNVVRGGDHATLILESADSRMSLPVICLQSGVRGQTIQVASPDHRRHFNAEVVATGMLKGSL